MLPMRFVAWTFSLIMTLAIGAAVGQDFPNKPIRIVVSEAGGGSDFVARLIAQGLAGPLSLQIIVDNRPSGVIPGDVVAKAPPDGHILLLAGNSLWIGHLLQKTPYDAMKDFAPVTAVGSIPSVLVVHPSLPVKSVKDLIGLAKARPGDLNYSSAGTGTATHLSAELFKSMANVNIVRIPYKGSAPAVNALIGGEAQLSFANAAAGLPHVKSGRLKALGVTSAQPSALLPGLPTVASGLPGYESVGLYGMFVPARTPMTVINRLNQEIVKFLNQPDVNTKFLNAGVEIIGSSPEKLAATMKSEVTSMEKVIKSAGIGVE